MKYLKLVLALVVLLAGAAGAARAADLSRAVMLAASEQLAGTPYEETILIAAPLPRGGHIGFIVNRPTEVKLAAIFPEHAPSHKVVDPVYVGGPVLAEAIFAVTREAPEGDAEVVALMPGLVAVIDGPGVDRVIETAPNDARYFAGLMLWGPGALEDEILEGYWNVRPASVPAVFLQP
jgi:putative AlgH/UPF0301 family transcriptional regulator